MNVNKRTAGFALIEILIILAIIAVAYYAITSYGLKGPKLQKDTVKSFSDQGMDTTSYKKILDSSKKIIDTAASRGSE